ncbi:alpha/beta hydrolase [Actinocorallia herbida]|uniref:alpha/beta hydrolase n=1 Tax=Actinocorallia herbida TaxID=58109 RepID=UPI00147757E7|nr:alpha/beta hydrolase [Actinocorallia herbida]
MSLALLGTALSPTGAAAADPFRGLAPQKIKWESCFGPMSSAPPAYARLECGTLKAPLDWRKPNGKKITLAVSRLKAKSGKPKSVLFTNPGGPGGYGLDLPLLFVAVDRERMQRNVDIIGIDVRGTGLGTQAACKKLTWSMADPRKAAGANALLAAAKKNAAACQKGASKSLPSRYVTTWQTVHDLEWIRRSMRNSAGAEVKKIDWLGYSAGTWLGAHYARYFPERARRFVLDSNVDFTSTWQKARVRQSKGFQDRFVKQWAPWAAKYDATYGLGKTASAVVARYTKVRAALVEKGPIKIEYELEGSGGLTYTEIVDGPSLDYSIAASMYMKMAFPYAADYLAYVSSVVFPANARARTERAPQAKDPYAGQDPTYFNITCNDARFTGEPADLKAQAAAEGEKYPLLGYYLVDEPCQFWKHPARNPVLKHLTGKKGPRLLMIQSALDPATPMAGALAAHRKYPNSRLVTVENEGDHAIYLSDNPCVDRIVENYLIDGKYPKKGTSCKGAPLPSADDADEVPIIAMGRAVNPLYRLAQISEQVRPLYSLPR